MRKIRQTHLFDDATCTAKIKVTVKNSDDNLVEVIEIDPTIEVDSKYTAQQLHEIKECNRALTSRGMPEMSEEIEYMLWPMIPSKEPSFDDLQKLSGFSVNKTVTYL